MWPKDFPSTIRVAVRASGNFLCSLGTFYAATGSSANLMCGHKTFCQFLFAAGLSVRPRDLPSTLRVAAGPSVLFLYSRRTFRAAARTFSQCSVWLWDLPCGRWTFSQLSVQPRDHLSTFHAAMGPFVNFLYGCRTFCAVTGPSANVPCSSRPSVSAH